ncbi:hypothetical protein LXL04_019640 [Taraxacum kok-saghyz]
MTKEMDPDHVSGYCVFSAIVSASPPFAVIGGLSTLVIGLEMKHPKCSTKCLKEALTKSFDAKMGEVAIPLENDHKPDRSDERERIKHDQNSRCFSIGLRTANVRVLYHLWNSFVRKQRVLADCHIPWTCEAFSKLHREDLVQAPSLLCNGSGPQKLFQSWSLFQVLVTFCSVWCIEVNWNLLSADMGSCSWVAIGEAKECYNGMARKQMQEVKS